MQVGRRERTSTCFTRDPGKNYLLPLLECECAGSFNPKLHCDPLMCNQGTSLSTLPISRHIALIVGQLEGNLWLGPWFKAQWLPAVSLWISKKRRPQDEAAC